MNPDRLRGNLDLIVLLILEGEPMYGFRIAKEARQRSQGYFDFKEGSLYPALHRLEHAGLIAGEERETGRNGKPRKYYGLTERGRAALAEQRAEYLAFHRAVRRLGDL